MKEISIITSVLNGEKTIRTCMESVASQDHDIEHIIIDGQSKDRTLEIVSSYDHVARVVSGKDRGIYDGLNKGLALASGEVIGFLHADDFLANPQILKAVCAVFKKDDIDSCYGDLVYVDGKNPEKIVRHWKSGDYSSQRFYWGWMPPHPAFFVRKKVYDKFGGFRLDMGTAADYELMLRFLLRHRISSVYLPGVVTKMRIGGLSNRSISNRIKANLNDRKAWQVNGLKPYPWTLAFKPLSKIKQFF